MDIHPAHVQTLLTYIQVGLQILVARVVLILTLLLTFGLFTCAVAAPTWERITAASLFAILVFLPATRIDAKMAQDRAILTPKGETE